MPWFGHHSTEAIYHGDAANPATPEALHGPRSAVDEWVTPVGHSLLSSSPLSVNCRFGISAGSLISRACDIAWHTRVQGPVGLVDHGPLLLRGTEPC